MEEVTKCRYIDCVDTREKEQILHELPVCDTGLCVRWLINSGHVDLIGSDLDALRSMKFFVCNNHFTEDCYLSKGTLKENAVPSPHWSAVSRTLRTLKTRRKIQLNGQEGSMEEVATNQLVEKNVPSEFEVDQWCRTCATKKQNLVSMTAKGKGTDMSLLSKLKLLIEIDDEDALPTKMCDECVDKLEQTFKFFQQIYVADNTLRHVFPSTRSCNTPRKPLYSIGEHMRKEQMEKEKEKEKEKEEEEQQQFQTAPKVSRGISRRGRGRPRTRGYAARARARQKSAQMQVPISSSNLNDSTVHNSRVNETAVIKNEFKSTMIHEEEKPVGNTVFSLLTDTCHSDEELDWSDVVKVMNDQRYRIVPRQEIERKMEEKIETKAKSEELEMKEEPRNEASLKTEVTTMVGAEMSETFTEKRKLETFAEVQHKLEMEEAKPGKEITVATSENELEQVRCGQFYVESFNLGRQLETRSSTDHSPLSEHMCTDCLTCYESESLLFKHRTLRHGERKYRCEHCQEEFVEKRTLREHVNKCQSHDSMLCYSCDSCGVQLSSKQVLIEHMKNHPESTVASFFHPPLASSPVVSPATVEDSKRSENVLSSGCSSIPSKSKLELELKLESEPEPVPVPVPETECSLVASSGTVATFESNTDEKCRTGVVVDTIDRANIAEEEQHRQKDEERSAVATAAAIATAITCPDCNEQVQNTVELSIHRMRRHSMNRKDATCLLCDSKSFPSLEEYEQHVLDHCKRLRISP
ncbi:Zinc finger protein 782 [Anthophora retusa]